MVRAFIAVDASSSESNGCSNEIARLQTEMISLFGWSKREVKPVEPHNFHFTLLFLGEVSDPATVEKIKQSLAEMKFESFHITYTGVGAFPHASNPRVLWVGLDPKGAASLEALAGQVVQRMGKVGFFPDKPFSAHLTIFRIKKSDNYYYNNRDSRQRHFSADLSKYAGRTFGTTLVDKVHLKKSDLSPSGPTYLNIYTVTAAH
jgi:2'-5' RNA ligase